MKYDFIIGIDPDTEKSGIAVLNASNREVELLSKTFPETIEFLKWFSETHSNFIIVVEAGWKVKKSNYHKVFGRRGENIAKKVGSNHETGKKIIQMLEYFRIPVIEHYPLKKIWNGHEGKITHEEISKFIKFPKKSNQEVRDAALLAWYYGNYPIIIK